VARGVAPCEYDSGGLWSVNLLPGARAMARCAIVLATLLACSPVLAESLDAEAARRFVLGKLFTFTCFDGTRGAGRVYDDGSAIGTIQVRGSGPVHEVWLPAGTLKIKRANVCASLSGIPFEPCFDLAKTGAQSFRGSLAGVDTAYCDFNHPLSVAGRKPAGPLSLHSDDGGSR
jgi:hypothetical protein